MFELSLSENDSLCIRVTRYLSVSRVVSGEILMQYQVGHICATVRVHATAH